MKYRMKPVSATLEKLAGSGVMLIFHPYTKRKHVGNRTWKETGKEMTATAGKCGNQMEVTIQRWTIFGNA